MAKTQKFNVNFETVSDGETIIIEDVKTKVVSDVGIDEYLLTYFEDKGDKPRYIWDAPQSED